MLATTAEHTAAAELQPPATAGPPDAHHGGAASSSSVTELVASSGATDDATWDSLMELTRPNQIYKGTNEWDHREALCAAALVLDRCKVQGALGFGLSNRKISWRPLANHRQPPGSAHWRCCGRTSRRWSTCKFRSACSRTPSASSWWVVGPGAWHLRPCPPASP